MSNEAVLKQRMSEPIDYIVANASGIEKGSVLKLTSPRTAINAFGTADKVAGIARREKIALDGRTRLSVFYDGIFDMEASGAIPVGSAVETAAVRVPGEENRVKIADIASSGAAILGYAMEDIADVATGEIMLRPGAGGAQIS